MNLPRLSDEELPALPKPVMEDVPGEMWGQNIAHNALYTDDQLQAAMHAAAEAQRLKDEQWMREQKPVGWKWELGGRIGFQEENPTSFTYTKPYSFTPLFAAPVPASQGDGFTLDQLASACIEAEIPDSKYESLCIALAAPVTTKESSHE